MEQAVSAANLVEVGGVTGLGQHFLGTFQLALLLNAVALRLLALPGFLLLLALPVVESLAVGVVLVLVLFHVVPLLPLLGLKLRSLVTEAVELLVSGVLFGLDAVQFGL